MWQPEEASLKALAELLNESQVPDNNKQKEIHKKINELSKQAEFCNYITYILSVTDNPNLNTLRKIAGATLKGVLERTWDKIPPENLNYVKLKLMETFSDQNPTIRSLVANAMTALFVKLGFSQWPELIQYLAHNLTQDNIALVESSLECVAKILEDMETDSENIDYFEEKSNSPLGELIPQLIFMCDPRFPSNIRALALRSLNLFTSLMPPSFIANMNNYFQALLICSEDQEFLVRQRSCEGFIGILEKRKDLVTANLEKILERMLRFTIDPSIEVKKKACLFWNEYLIIEENEPMDRIEALHKCLDFLMPTLIDCLPYTEEDLLTLDSTASAPHLATNYLPADDEDEEEGIFEVPEDNADMGEYTLRKEAGKAIEALARRYENDAFIKSQVKLAECLKSENWLIREAGILCLGALAKGAFEVIVEHFKDLFPFLMDSLGNKEPLIRCIACWTLSRFTKWILDQGNLDMNIVKVYLTSVLKLMMDENAKVEQAACTALSRLCLQGKKVTQEFVTDIVQVIKIVGEKYDKETMKFLYDAIGSLACNLPPELTQSPNVEPVLIELIVKKWSESNFDDVEATCLVECSDSLISALEGHAVNYAEFFVKRIMLLIYNYVQATKADDKKDPFHKREIAIRCFDFLDTFFSILEGQSEQFINAADYYNIFQQCVQDQEIGLKQIVISSAHQAAKSCPNLLKNYVQPLAEILLTNLYYAPKEIDTQGLYMGCCNNAASAIGDLALIYPAEFHAFIPTFAQKIVDIFVNNNKLHRGLSQTLAIALGKLGYANPEAVAPLLEHFLKKFCMSIGAIQGDIEKQQAFRGLFSMILKNPNGIIKDFAFLCYCLADFRDVPQDIHELATKILHEFKSFAGENWNILFNKFPIHIREDMNQKYGV